MYHTPKLTGTRAVWFFYKSFRTTVCDIDLLADYAGVYHKPNCQNNGIAFPVYFWSPVLNREVSADICENCLVKWFSREALKEAYMATVASSWFLFSRIGSPKEYETDPKFQCAEHMCCNPTLTEGKNGICLKHAFEIALKNKPDSKYLQALYEAFPEMKPWVHVEKPCTQRHYFPWPSKTPQELCQEECIRESDPRWRELSELGRRSKSVQLTTSEVARVAVLRAIFQEKGWIS